MKIDHFIEKSENTKINRAWNIVSVFTSFHEMMSNITETPNHYKEILEYCAFNSNYSVDFELTNGVTYNAEYILNAIENS